MDNNKDISDEAVTDAVADEEKKKLTSRSYKIKAIVIIFLLLVAFMIKDFVIFKETAWISKGSDIFDFLKWWLDEKKVYLIAGAITLLIPYELIHDEFIHICKSVEPNIRRNRRRIIVVASMIVPFLASYVMMLDWKYSQWVIICGAVLELLICLNLRQFFYTVTGWLVFAALHTVCIFLLLLYFIYNKADKEYDSLSFFRWIDVIFAILFLIIAILAILLSLSIYATFEEDKTFKCFIENMIIVFSPVGMLAAFGHLKSEYVFSSEGFRGLMPIGEYSGYRFIDMSLAVFIIILLICAAKLVSKYSRRRMILLIMCSFLTVFIIISDILARIGVLADYTSYYLLLDMVNSMILFIVARTLIIPVASCPDLKCRFIEPELEIIDMKYEKKKMEIEICSLKKQLSCLLNMVVILDFNDDVWEGECIDLFYDDEQWHDAFLKYTDFVDKFKKEREKDGMPIDIAQLNEIIGKIRKEEQEKIKELYSEYIAETMDDDELENEAGGKKHE